MYGAPVLAARVVQVGARRQVRHAVAVEVAHGCHGYAEAVVVGKARPVLGRGVDLRGALYRAVGIHQHDVYGAPARAFRAAAPGGARRQVGDAVAVQVTRGRDGYPEKVAVSKARPVLGGRVDLHRALYHAVGVYRAVAVHPAAAVHQHDMYGARVGTICPVVPGGARRQVRHAVAVQVAHKRHGYAEKVAVVQPGAVLCAVVDLRGAFYRAVGAHQHYVHGARVGTVCPVVPGGARRQVRHAVAVQIADERHGPPKGVARRQVGAVPGGVADLRGALYRAVPDHQHHVHGARVDAALAVVPGGARRQVRRAVAVQVGHGRHGRPEGIVNVQVWAVLRTVIDLHGGQHETVGAYRHDVHGSLVGAVRVVPGGAGCQVRHAVAVQVAQERHGRPEEVLVGQVGAAGGGAVDLRGESYRAVRVHQHHVNGAPVAAVRAAVPGGARRQVRHAVAVQIAHERHGRSEEIIGIQARAVVRAVVDLHCFPYRAVAVHEHHVNGARVVAVRAVIVGGAHRQVWYSVAVDVAHGRDGRPEEVLVGQVGAAGGGAVDLRGESYRAVRVHQHHVNGAPVAAVRAAVPGGARRQVRHAVAVQIAHERHGRSEEIIGIQARAVVRAVVDLHCFPYRAVAVHEHHVNGARVVAVRAVIVGGAHRQVWYSVAVDVAHGRDGRPEVVPGRQVWAVVRAAVDLRGAHHRAACPHQHDVHGSRVVAVRAVIVWGARRQVLHAVAVEVTDGRHGRSEVVPVVQGRAVQREVVYFYCARKREGPAVCDRNRIVRRRGDAACRRVAHGAGLYVKLG